MRGWRLVCAGQRICALHDLADYGQVLSLAVGDQMGVPESHLNIFMAKVFHEFMQSHFAALSKPRGKRMSQRMKPDFVPCISYAVVQAEGIDGPAKRGGYLLCPSASSFGEKKRIGRCAVPEKYGQHFVREKHGFAFTAFGIDIGDFVVFVDIRASQAKNFSRPHARVQSDESLVMELLRAEFQLLKQSLGLIACEEPLPFVVFLRQGKSACLRREWVDACIYSAFDGEIDSGPQSAKKLFGGRWSLTGQHGRLEFIEHLRRDLLNRDNAKERLDVLFMARLVGVDVFPFAFSPVEKRADSTCKCNTLKVE